MKEKKYYLGLDIGTNSVGWAVTDQNYNIARIKGQDLWGVRKFPEAEDASKRRSKRSVRRNLSRRKVRLGYLNQIFKPELDKVDKNFLTRLKESQLYLEDKTTSQKHTLFNDANFTDADFHAKYKTVNHLIVDLIENPTKDVRLLYLGIHKLLKNRGHFLFEGLDVSNGIDFESSQKNMLDDLNKKIASALSEEATIDFNGKEEEFFAILKQKITKTDKSNKIVELLGLTGKDDVTKQKKEILLALVGRSAKLSLIFNDELLKEDKEKDKFVVDKEEFDDYLSTINNHVDLDGIELLSCIKRIYDWNLLSEILKGQKLVSYGMMQTYDNHRQDLKMLKDHIIKNYPREVYLEVFKTNKSSLANYASYVGHIKKGGKKQYIKKCDQEKFYGYIKKILKNDESQTAKEILSKIEMGNFMPKQVSKANAAIPNQLRCHELKLILEKNAKNFRFLSHVDESEVSNSEKLLRTCRFRVPYYVGPLNDKHSIDKGGFAWVQKKKGFEREKVTPWNFDKIVELDKSNKAFYEKLIGNCTYLMGQKVLPKHSLINAEFVILNTINKIKINFSPIDLKTKQELFEHLKGLKKIGRKTIEKFLVSNNVVKKGEEELIKGIDSELNLSFPAYSKFVDILGENISYQHDFDIMENIILWATQSVDSNMLKKKIKENYSDRFSEEEIEKLSYLKFADWANLSKKFLSGITSINYETGERCTLIDALYQTDFNLQELLYNEFNFKKIADEFNEKYIEDNNVSETLLDKVNNSYASSSVKRQIWQVLLLVKELKKIIPVPFTKIFVEMARGGDENKKRTVSRKKELLEIYTKHFKKEARDWVAELNLTEESRFRREGLYLYYKQMGKCAYSGESISLDELFNFNMHDIDHIYPRSKIKDESIHNNKVLVKRHMNQLKGDNLPINPDIRKKMTPTWEAWHRAGFINKEKLSRLKRNVELTVEECTDFINRQIVETRQTSKLVTELLKDVFKDSRIVYVKARNIGDFKEFHRKQIVTKDGKLTSDIDDFIKVRELNDLHHAKDAYLNVVVGNVYNVKFGYDASEYFKKNGISSYNLRYLYANNIRSAWSVEKGNKTINVVKFNYAKNTPIVTNMAYEKTGAFYNETLYPAKQKDDKLIPLKTSPNVLGGKLSDTSKYGGYKSPSRAYACVVRYTKGKKTITQFEFVPVLVVAQIKEGLTDLQSYFKKLLKADNVEILYDKIKINSLFKKNGTFVTLTGTSSGGMGWNNASQLILSNKEADYFKKIVKYNKRCSDLKVKYIKINQEYDKISKEDSLKLYDIFVKKLQIPVYANLKPNYVQALIERRDMFKDLSEEEQAVLLFEISKLFQTNASTSNFELIGMGTNLGNLKTGKYLDGYSEIKLIKASVTGLFKEEIDLKKL